MKGSPFSAVPVMLTLLSALAACSAGPAVSDPERPIASASAAELARGPLGLVLTDPPPPAAAEAPSTVEGKVDVPVVTVALPAKTPTVVDIAGRGEEEVYLLTAKGNVLQWNGKDWKDLGAPKCFAESCCGTLVDCKAHPQQCAKKATEQCAPMNYPSCAFEVQFDYIQAEPDVRARTVIQTGGLRGSLLEAKLGADGKWTCVQGDSDLVHPDSAGRGDVAHPREYVVDGASFRFEGPARLVNPLGGHILTIDGRRINLPEPTNFGVSLNVLARSRDDLWLYSYDPLLWHGNGLDWHPVELALETLEDIWLDGDKNLWVLGSSAGQTLLLRRDLAKDTWHRTLVPGATSSVAGMGRDFWLVGDSFYYSDGSALKKVDVQIGLQGSWRSKKGDVWLVGGPPGLEPDEPDLMKSQEGRVLRLSAPMAGGAR